MIPTKKVCADTFFYFQSANEAFDYIKSFEPTAPAYWLEYIIKKDFVGPGWYSQTSPFIQEEPYLGKWRHGIRSISFHLTESQDNVKGLETSIALQAEAYARTIVLMHKRIEHAQDDVKAFVALSQEKP